MNNIFKVTLVLLLLIAFKPTYAQQDTSLVVNGVCQMCKRVIEKAAYLDGVETASWNVKTKELSLKYDPSKVTLMDINKSVLLSGYDTEYEAAKDEDYYKLHKCCYYRDPEVVKDHEDEN
jgi:cation transport ATPase